MSFVNTIILLFSIKLTKISLMKSKNESRKNKIIKVTSKIIVTDGLAKVSILEIAKKTKISHSNIYIYFKDKEDLLISVFTHHLNLYTSYLEQNISLSESVDNVLNETVKSIYDFNQSNPTSIKVIQLMRADPHFRKVLPSVNDSQLFIKLFNWIENEKYANNVRDFNSILLADILFNSILSYSNAIQAHDFTDNEVPMSNFISLIRPLFVDSTNLNESRK